MLAPVHDGHWRGERIATEYRPEPKLGILVPDLMKETCQTLALEDPGLRVLPNAHARSANVDEPGRVVTVEATTRYSAYRRFEVDTNETYTIPPRKPE